MGINERRVAVASIAKLIPSNPRALATPLRRGGDTPILKILPKSSLCKGKTCNPDDTAQRATNKALSHSYLIQNKGN